VFVCVCAEEMCVRVSECCVFASFFFAPENEVEIGQRAR
jgi:hypothetical protein